MSEKKENFYYADKFITYFNFNSNPNE